ncbi:ORF6C domain-containing protein [Cohnella zeiphila]|uniref:ORF6C domain-containing protein n=1 Tax=Cohnella zeiphila TaxID=2761120 RepID=A0A7X0SNE8_9BACL|nr:ORF6C domain-containing protein [Cohnella zeiphila]MBB6731925.1 ORF6C domain-containing protein [Cohnella zeiphila]
MSTKSLVDHRLDKILSALEVVIPDVQDLKSRVGTLEMNMVCESRKRLNLKKRAESHVTKILGGKDSDAYKNDYRGTIRHLWMDYWQAFGVTTYHDTPAVLYDKAIEFIDEWRPQSIRGLEDTKSA